MWDYSDTKPRLRWQKKQLQKCKKNGWWTDIYYIQKKKFNMAAI